MQPHYFTTIATFIEAHTPAEEGEKEKGPASVASSTTSFEMVEEVEEE